MTAAASNIPSKIFYHFVTKQQSVDQLFNALYEKRNDSTKQHFLAGISHLKRSLGLSNKSLTHQLKGHLASTTDRPGFEKNNARVRQYGI